MLDETWNLKREFDDEEEKKMERDDDGVQDRIYDSNKYVSQARRVPSGTVPINILQFYHSFSYDCQRYFNLCVVEPNVVIFASGNILHFLNTMTNELWFRRGFMGGGIGHVTKNPTFDHIAIGENGIRPPIIIYKWPSMDIVKILYNGTIKSYCHLAYSADGLLLVSQGGDPDYTLILWDWQKSEITLKCKSYNRNVYNITMTPSLHGHLMTSGSGHIKFWKISETFTGLKLKGEIGRFGQIEISDIVGMYIMPDGKVVSGCEWGNILVWEEGLITLEICRKNRQPCHAKAITQFEYMNGELISVGMDGWIRIWFYETIDEANSYNEERFLEIQPIYEYHISDGANGSMLMCICKQEPDNPENTFWYAQDGNGGIWLIDLHSLKAELPRKIFTCHAGAIVDMDNATWGPFVSTLSKAGQLHIYNYLKKKLILVHKFNDIGSQVIWFPCQGFHTFPTPCTHARTHALN